MLAKAVWQAAWIFTGVHIRFFGNGRWRFRPDGDSLFLQAPKKSKQKNARPERPAPRQGSGFLRSGIHPGALPSGRLRATYMQWVRLRRTALRAHPRMNTSTQPAEGAGGSRSRAAGELTLGLLSGEERRGGACCCVFAFLWERAWSGRRSDDDGLPADSILTGERTPRSGRPAGRLAFAFAFALAFDLLAPSRGRAQVLRSGQPGMDAGLAAPGHGWPMAAGPRSRTGARECRALARHRTSGARALGYLGLFQVTRCKSGTARGRYRSNGYVHPQNYHRLTQSHREQARSHRNCNDLWQRAWFHGVTILNCGANVSRLPINSPSFLPLPCNLIRPFCIVDGISSCLRLICSRVALLMVTLASA
ncbi:hypothetical protein PS726_00813 [Pseudomonas fluorescens]|nr:hypothetical protein PS726_00813 [Pseudomonas fluorescens]